MQDFKLMVTESNGSTKTIEIKGASLDDILRAVEFFCGQGDHMRLDWVGPGELIAAEGEIEDYQNEIMRLESLLEDAREGKYV